MSLKQKLFFAFLLLAFLPTSLLLIFSYRLATEGADLLAARGISQTLAAADSLAVAVVAAEQLRLHADGEKLWRMSTSDFRQSVEVDSHFAFARVTYSGREATAYGDTAAAHLPESRAAAGDSSGRTMVGSRLLIWELASRDTVCFTYGRFLPDSQFSLVSRVTDGRAHYLSLSKNLLPGGKNLLLKITAALIIVSLILSLLAAQSLSYSLSAPLERLVEATRRVSRGDWKYRIPTAGRDEIGVLTTNFNAMTETIEETTKNLILAEKEMTWRDNARTIAHEIKNLLTPVNVALYKIKRRLLDGSQPDSELNAGVDALTSEIDAIADLAKQFALFAHPAKLACTSVDLGALVRQVLAFHADAVKRRQVTTNVEAEGITVFADADLLRRVLSNLLKNAVEATSDDGSIAISANEQPDGYILEVSDDGVGADESLDLTQPYLTTKRGGTGLGLAIVKKVCDAHGWTFSYQNLKPGFSARITGIKKS